MQLLHIADLHFGRLLYARSLMDDQRHFVRQSLLPALDEYKPDALLIAGDLYDRQIASVDAIHLFDELIDALCERSIPAVIISGNHDSPDRIAVGKSLLARHGIHIITELKDAFTPVEIGNIQIFPLPYFENAQMRDFLGDETLRGAGACMRAAMEKMEKAFDPAKKHVLVAHCFAAGASTSDSESRLFVGGAGDVPTDVFSPFDYAARGAKGRRHGALRRLTAQIFRRRSAPEKEHDARHARRHGGNNVHPRNPSARRKAHRGYVCGAARKRAGGAQ